MSESAVRFASVGKMYKAFPNRRENLRDALGLPRFRSRRAPRYTEFWALRDISFELGRGERLGIIGRNGAGKSTLLKIVTGNLPPTEGTSEVRGGVQALLEVGGGLHPEFTGRENIHASLGLMGLDAPAVDAATTDIAEFTELGRFLDQPFKTYSMGMQARLSLGIATSIKPEILIIDEVLGAGDAYFFAKSSARMQDLLGSGASVLLVSHALDQIVRFCNETMWLDRGRIVMRGETREVVKAYERFTREIDSRRLHAKNRKSQSASFDSFARDSYTEFLSVEIRGEGDISSITLVRDGDDEDALAVGDAQDADASQSAQIVADRSWSEPLEDAGRFYRKVNATARALFNLWFLYPTSKYAIRVEYRSPVDLEIAVATGRGSEQNIGTLVASQNWTECMVQLPLSAEVDHRSSDVAMSRWEGSATFTIAEVLLQSGSEEQEIFSVNDEFSVALTIRANRDGAFPLIPAVLVFSSEGIVATRHVGEQAELVVKQGDLFTVRLDFGPLLLGNGTFLVSAGLYGRLDPEDIQPPSLYDYLDRSFEFRIVGNPKLHNELVNHPGTWTITAGGDRRNQVARHEAVDA